MTKEEAVEWLKSLNYCDGEETQEVAQAIDMAIKSLEQQPSDEQVRILNCENIDIQKFTEAMKHQPQQVKQPSKDCVSLEVYKQVVWERDIAIEQLKELGYSFGEKIRTSEDCVSRAEVLKQMKEWRDCEFVKMTNPYHYLEKRIQSMSPVTPTRKAPREDITENEVRINMLELALNLAKESAESTVLKYISLLLLNTGRK